MSERVWRRLNAGATVAWLALIPVAYFGGWLASVVFVSAISLYANVASHLAAWRADDNRALFEKLDRIEQQLDPVTRAHLEGRAMRQDIDQVGRDLAMYGMAFIDDRNHRVDPLDLYVFDERDASGRLRAERYSTGEHLWIRAWIAVQLDNNST